MAANHAKVPWVRTPLVRSAALSRAAGCNIYLKLENVQPSGSFKSRGIGNFLLSRLTGDGDEVSPQRGASSQNGSTAHYETISQSGSVQRINDAEPAPQLKQQVRFYCSSGGNAGLACVHAAVTLGCPAIIVVPHSTTAYMIAKLRDAGAEDVIQHGASWAEADGHLVQDILPAAREKGEHAVYVPPFDAPEIWAGNSTIVHEIVEQMTEVDSHYPTAIQGCSHQKSNGPDAIVCSVGGGGLFAGVMQGLNDLEMVHTQVITTETVGADSLHQSVKHGERITLPSITSIATSLGARQVCKMAFKYAMEDARVSCVVLSDAEAVKACKLFANDERVLIEPACAVSVALCYNKKLADLVKGFSKYSRVVIVVCGGSNMSLSMMADYMEKFCVE